MNGEVTMVCDVARAGGFNQSRPDVQPPEAIMFMSPKSLAFPTELDSICCKPGGGMGCVFNISLVDIDWKLCTVC